MSPNLLCRDDVIRMEADISTLAQIDPFQREIGRRMELAGLIVRQWRNRQSQFRYRKAAGSVEYQTIPIVVERGSGQRYPGQQYK